MDIYYKDFTKPYILLTALCFSTLVFSQEPTIEGLEFDSSFLMLSEKKTIDLSRFSNGSSALPGKYSSVFYLNGNFVIDTEVLIKSKNNNSTYACITPEIASYIDLDYSSLPKEAQDLISSHVECLDLEKILPNSSVSFNSNSTRLDIYIPQIYMNRSARGTVDPTLWDNGINAGLLTYSINAYNSESHGDSYQSVYSLLSTGFNIGSWYFRQNGAIDWNSISDNVEYSSLSTYVQRDIPEWKSRVMFGQLNTQGQLFDTIPFTGARLSSDERMLPGSQRGYAPEIRGIARTSAKVTVRQNDQVIYETTVSPGEFLINDLYPLGYGGDLDVTVKEADGSEEYFLVPYASVAQLLRPDSQRFSITAGQYRNDSLATDPFFLEGTYQRGITNSLTAFTGAQLNSDYYAIQGGMGLGTPIGAFSAQVTHSGADLDKEGTESGQSYEMTYSKLISETSSNITLAAYRFSTKGYMDFETAMSTIDAVSLDKDYSNIYRPKSRYTLTASQGLGSGWGNLYISSSIENYWASEEENVQYQLGYTNNYGRLSYGFNATHTQNDIGDGQTNYMLTVNVPLDYWKGNISSAPLLRFRLNHDSDGRAQQQVGISDSVGDDNQFSYGVTASHGNAGQASSIDINGSYISPITSLSATYSSGSDYQSESLGLSGSLIAHSGGVTFSPYTGNTYALVEAPGAKGATVSSYSGAKIDSNGYAIVPNLNAYEYNDIYIDPKNAPENIEFENTSEKVVPYSNAIVPVKFKTKQGDLLLINSTHNGDALPFGASVLDEENETVGYVGQGSELYIQTDKKSGLLKVVWGDISDNSCTVLFDISELEKASFYKMSLDCE